MTDMKISHAAVAAAQKAPDRYVLTPLVRDIIAAALTYYAAHPDELPQEVLDAVRGTDKMCQKCKGTGDVIVNQSDRSCPDCQGTGWA